MNSYQQWTRRDCLRGLACGVAFGGGWLRAFAADAVDHPQRIRSVVSLWLSGGPATIDLWDLKPGHANGGPFQEIETAAAGLRISEHLPLLAKSGRDLVVFRSLSSKEGDHSRATHLARTGYVPQAAIQFPAVGSLVAQEREQADSDLPAFVSIVPSRNMTSLGGGFLGPRYSPFAVGEGATVATELTVPNLERDQQVSEAVFSNRLEILAGLERRFGERHPSPVVTAQQSATARGARLMQPAVASAFDLNTEADMLRDAYGRNVFGQGCLLARRLVERQVPFVEVTLDGWDTHNNNFERVKTLSQTLDAGFATLLNDLRERGLLESTLIICQGEFGRTPKINGNTGRDHWPQSWATVLAGGGLSGGQAIGTTSADGMRVEERVITVPDVIATVCRAVGIDPRKQNLSNVGRPIRIADPDAKVIEEVFA